jgi:hypothetical protein
MFYSGTASTTKVVSGSGGLQEETHHERLRA